VGTHAEVLDGLSGILGTTQQNNVAAGGGLHGELIESEALTTSSLDAGTSGGGEAESSDGHLWDSEKAVVIGDGANDGHGLTLVGLLRRFGTGLRNDSGDGNGRTVDSGHEEAAEDDLVEVGIGAACS
jgi:hypothetical protein